MSEGSTIEVGVRCASCGVDLEEAVLLRGPEGGGSRWKCVRCALLDRALVWRSSRVALLVGTVLVALNQGDQLLLGTFPFATSWWKLPLTYLVPYCVVSYGAISNGVRPVAPAPLESESRGV
jgi:hypothetical protein